MDAFSKRLKNSMSQYFDKQSSVEERIQPQPQPEPQSKPRKRSSATSPTGEKVSLEKPVK